jgi:hypothetical protein
MARFDGGPLSSDAGVLVFREVEPRLGAAERLAGCIADPRAQNQVVHGLADIIRFRMLMIAAGYEDGNDASSLRSDPAFKLAQGALPSGPDLASQPAISRLENLPDRRSLLRMGQAPGGCAWPSRTETTSCGSSSSGKPHPGATCPGSGSSSARMLTARTRTRPLDSRWTSSKSGTFARQSSHRFVSQSTVCVPGLAS